MRTGQWKTMGIGSLIGKMIYAVFGLAASMLCIMGYYPVVPAFYTACCLDKKRNFLLYIGLVVGMGWCMPVAAIVKYLFILFVLGIAIRFYIWANRRCSGWTAGMIAGITTIAMNTSGLLILNMEKKALILGISEGVIVFALAVLFHYGIGMGSQIFRERHKNRVEQEGVETMEQFEMLKGLGCDVIQGYLYSKPLLTDDFQSFVNGATDLQFIMKHNVEAPYKKPKYIDFTVDK